MHADVLLLLLLTPWPPRSLQQIPKAGTEGPAGSPGIFLSYLKEEEGKEFSVLQTNFCPERFPFPLQKRSPMRSSGSGHSKAPF